MFQILIAHWPSSQEISVNSKDELISQKYITAL